uniref:THAP domain-containing protein 4 n=1 Tax=Cacopsylla melanoneura TaxID=428564 RepID=A0A8D8VVF6_9HEMI
MVISCSAFKCTNRQIPLQKRSGNEREIHFHRFPVKNKQLLKKWIHATKRINWKPTIYSFLCSDHFLPHDYKMLGTKKLTLHEDSVPSVFDFPEHLKKKKKSPRRELEQQHISNEPTLCPSEYCEQTMSTPVPSSSTISTSTPGPSLSSSIPESNSSSSNSESMTDVQSSRSSSKASSSVPRCSLCKFSSSPSKAALQRKNKILQMKLWRREKKITSLQELIKGLKRSLMSNVFGEIRTGDNEVEASEFKDPKFKITLPLVSPSDEKIVENKRRKQQLSKMMKDLDEFSTSSSTDDHKYSKQSPQSSMDLRKRDTKINSKNNNKNSTRNRK